MPAMPPIISPPLAKMARPSEATIVASTMPCTSSAIGAVVLSLVLMFNHRPGRYMGV